MYVILEYFYGGAGKFVRSVYGPYEDVQIAREEVPMYEPGLDVEYHIVKLEQKGY